MSDNERFDFMLPAKQRRELLTLAEAAGVPAASLARLGVSWVLRKRDAILTGGIRDWTPETTALVERITTIAASDAPTAARVSALAGLSGANTLEDHP